MADQRETSVSASFYPCAATRWAVNQPKSMIKNSPDEARTAALRVAANSVDADDCRLLLDMLGLELTGEEVLGADASAPSV